MEDTLSSATDMKTDTCISIGDGMDHATDILMSTYLTITAPKIKNNLIQTKATLSLKQ